MAVGPEGHRVRPGVAIEVAGQRGAVSDIIRGRPDSVLHDVRHPGLSSLADRLLSLRHAERDCARRRALRAAPDAPA